MHVRPLALCHLQRGGSHECKNTSVTTELGGNPAKFPPRVPSVYLLGNTEEWLSVRCKDELAAVGLLFLDNLQDMNNLSLGCFGETLLERGIWKEPHLQSFSKNEQSTASQHNGMIVLGESDLDRQ